MLYHRRLYGISMDKDDSFTIMRAVALGRVDMELLQTTYGSFILLPRERLAEPMSTIPSCITRPQTVLRTSIWGRPLASLWTPRYLMCIIRMARMTCMHRNTKQNMPPYCDYIESWFQFCCRSTAHQLARYCQRRKHDRHRSS